MQNLTRRIKSRDKIAMDFNVVNSMRHENKVLVLKPAIRYLVFDQHLKLLYVWL